jgi:hypothetical protein
LTDESKNIDLEGLRDPEQIFLATSLRTARQVEDWLAQAGIDYVVQVEPFGRSVIFRTVRNGAAFYVAAADAAQCREGLDATGLAGVVWESEPD